MDTDTVVNDIRHFRECLERRGIHASRVVLFGSHATGTAHAHSDIDVVVISSDFAGHDLWERIQLLSPAICESNVRIEAIALTPEEWESGQSPVVEFAAAGRDI
ncbi:MAG: nucleotidyltransferase domain-containing protein [Phycisphaerales bacterium]|jgi:predicted nucleotidyltransferase|nr:nucleotidyltransferase domain-containing protein [Phycisphaerales bacterium]